MTLPQLPDENAGRARWLNIAATAWLLLVSILAVVSSVGLSRLSEQSQASAQGGVTTGLTYMRTGQYYLNRGGSYAEMFPEVLALTDERAYVDYAFHLAPMMKDHIDEIPALIEKFGVTSFKIFMFYGSHGLHGRSSDQSSFLMIPEDERYDLAHFEFVMRGVQAAREKLADKAQHIALSLHCEAAEIMTAYTRLVEQEGARQLAAIPAGAHVVALDRTGKQLDTEALAQEIKKRLASGEHLALLVGGPEGLAPACLERAKERWALSKLTLAHPVVRVVLAEQLYRAWSIINQHPYHR